MFKMKNVLVTGLFMVFSALGLMANPSVTSNDIGVSNAEVGVRVRVCFKTKKGRRCITVTISKGIADMFDNEEIFGSMQGSNILLLNGLSKEFTGQSFRVGKSQVVEMEGKSFLVMPGKYTIENGTVSLKLGPGEKEGLRRG